MAFTGEPFVIGSFGGRFLGSAGPEEPTPMPQDLRPTALAAGLAGVQNLKRDAAAQFWRVKHAGVVATGRGIEYLATHIDDVDRRGAEAIGQIFPETAPGTAGGR